MKESDRKERRKGEREEKQEEGEGKMEEKRKYDWRRLAKGE